jgi:GTP cyclohydrolase FolE2
MLRQETWSFSKARCSADLCSEKRKEHMSRTIKAIERHMIPRSSRLQTEATARQATQPIQIGERKLVAEWQRGAEILGHAQRKLRLAFAPTQSPALATPNR